MPIASIAIRSEYLELAERAGRFNSDPEHLSSWWLDYEHCFESDLGEIQPLGYDEFPTFPDALSTRVMDFVEKPGAVDFLFDHLLQNRADDPAVLVDAEMLMFFSEIARYAPSIIQPSHNAAGVLRAVRSGAFAKANSRYLTINIYQIIEVSAERCKAVSN